MGRSELIQAVLDVLRKNSGKMMESSLIKTLQSRYRDVTLMEVRKALLVMELNGIVRVHSLDDERKLISVVGVK
ncbi:MAG: hypothetical protein NZ988_06410 [Thaumarchaeota archaeon]|nr:hypothetical protein [Candidatus Calditenuaceae archaeon]MDW8187654.1 hypothetical protein [Nitrososphaerota archaeon]